ncbi:MAG: hypothetical protein ACD_7C00556G0005 [uncultured bacterium]|nr:MAG: hypothetical protein ACD_7C00556G0005 [uncultured bacterium]HBR78968.1 hypothetical protein [Candidatus Moranbacteria bacterium]
MCSCQAQLKKNSRILKSIRKIGLVLVLFFFGLSLNNISGTSSFLTDTVKVEGMEFAMDIWIPTLTMTIEPDEPDGEDSVYTEAPCVKFFSDIDNVIIHYSFSGETPREETVLEGVCLYPPEGESEFSAWAVNNENDGWMSAIITQDFNVGELIKSGDVIINEVMWMGSQGKSKDQWIELKNVTEKDIHIKNWYLTYKSDAGNELELLKIKDDRVIKSGEYYLASYYTKNNSAINETPDSSDLKNFGYKKFQIKLYADDSKKVLIDTAGDGAQEPEEGDKDYFYSMERKNTPADGANYDNWYTCLDASSADLYWDKDRLERGTPGHKNLSKNDSTSPDYDPDFKETITKIGETIVNSIVNISTPDKIQEPTTDKEQEEPKEQEEIDFETPATVEEEKAPLVEEESEESEEVDEDKETEEPVKESIVEEIEKKEPVIEE